MLLIIVSSILAQESDSFADNLIQVRGGLDINLMITLFTFILWKM